MALPPIPPRLAAVTIGIMDFIIVFLIMFGVRYSWQIYFMSRIWIVWLLILQLKDTDVAQRGIKMIENQVHKFLPPNKKQK